jgi:hypothetical protein
MVMHGFCGLKKEARFSYPRHHGWLDRPPRSPILSRLTAKPVRNAAKRIA